MILLISDTLELPHERHRAVAFKKEKKKKEKSLENVWLWSEVKLTIAAIILLLADIQEFLKCGYLYNEEGYERQIALFV